LDVFVFILVKIVTKIREPVCVVSLFFALFLFVASLVEKGWI
jgi:hypothetical protein